MKRSIPEARKTKPMAALTVMSTVSSSGGPDGPYAHGGKGGCACEGRMHRMVSRKTVAASRRDLIQNSAERNPRFIRIKGILIYLQTSLPLQ